MIPSKCNFVVTHHMWPLLDNFWSFIIWMIMHYDGIVVCLHYVIVCYHTVCMILEYLKVRNYLNTSYFYMPPMYMKPLLAVFHVWTPPPKFNPMSPSQFRKGKPFPLYKQQLIKFTWRIWLILTSTYYLLGHLLWDSWARARAMQPNGQSHA